MSDCPHYWKWVTVPITPITLVTVPITLGQVVQFVLVFSRPVRDD